MPTAGLRSSLSRTQLFAFGFGTIVGIGWIVLTGQLLSQAGLLGSFVGLSVGALLVLPVAACYAKIGSLFPLVGGEVAYARESYGQTTSNFVGWFLLLSCLLVCCFEMISVGWVLAELWPRLESGPRYLVFGGEVHVEPLLVSLAIQGLIVAANFRGTHLAGRLQAFLTLTKIGLTLIFVLAALRVAQLAYARPLFVVDSSGSTWPGVLSVVTIAPFWFSGFNAISQAVPERSTSVGARRATTMILFSLGGAWLFYCLVLLCVSLVMPRQLLLSRALPTAAAFQAAFQSAPLGNAVLFAGLLGLMSTWNAVFFSATRILFSLAERGFVPRPLRTLHTRFGTPTAAILVLGLLIPVGATMGRGVIGPLLSAFSVVMGAIYGLVCAGLVVLRRRHAPSSRAPGESWIALALPYIGSVASVAICGLALLEPLRSQNAARVPTEWIVLIMWAAVGIFLWRTQGATAGVSHSKASG